MRHYYKLLTVLACCLLFSSTVLAQTAPPSSPRTISWQGLYLGTQTVTPIDHFPTRRTDLAVTLNAIIGIQRRYSFQVQFIQPVNGSKPLVRFGFDVRIF